jgi:putative hemolysin
VALGKFIETGHSRIPIYAEKIDSIKGLLYAKDLLTMWHNGGPKIESIADIVRPVYFVPEDKRADLVLKEMQAGKIHFAVVVDEYGGTAGIVTIENLIEEIIGDIQDEYDPDEEDEFIKQGEHEYMIDASMDLDDMNELLDVNLPTEENDTLGGFIYSQLGRVPTVGEVIDDTERNLMMRVESVDGRRIRKVHVTRIAKSETDDEDAEQVNEKAG